MCRTGNPPDAGRLGATPVFGLDTLVAIKAGAAADHLVCLGKGSGFVPADAICAEIVKPPDVVLLFLHLGAFVYLSSVFTGLVQ